MPKTLTESKQWQVCRKGGFTGKSTILRNFSEHLQTKLYNEIYVEIPDKLIKIKKPSQQPSSHAITSG